MSHKVEVSRLCLRIVPMVGPPVSACFFLRPVGSRVERLGDRLNEPGVFFVPVEIHQHSEMLRLSWISYLEYKGILPEVEELIEQEAARKPVLITLLDGKVIQGELLYVLPPDRGRISDLLNMSSSRFLLMVDAGTTRFVSCASIARVRPTAAGD